MKYSLKRSLTIILCSTVLVSGTAWVVLFSLNYIKAKYSQDKTFVIRAILQTGPEWEALKTVYLAETVGLSIDKPTNLFQFDIARAEKKLLQNPIIKAAKIKKIKPDTIYIDYSIRHPIATLADFTNTGIDQDGILFPLFPFITPKKLPEIYLGHSFEENLQLMTHTNSIWGQKLNGREINLAFTLLNLFETSIESQKTHLIRIDVSQAFENNFGKRQIVCLLDFATKDKSSIHQMIRLSTKNYPQEISNLLVFIDSQLVQESIKASQQMIIDLRIPQIAYISH